MIYMYLICFRATSMIADTRVLHRKPSGVESPELEKNSQHVSEDLA